MPKKTVPEIQPSPDYNLVADLLDTLGEIRNKLAARQLDVDTEYRDMIHEHTPEVVTLQAEEQKALDQLEALAAIHPEWFKDRQSLKLIAGVIKYNHSTELEIADEELTFKLLAREERDYSDALAAGDEAALKRTPFYAGDFIRSDPKLNLRALATLDDATLARLKIKRVPKDNFKAEPAGVDLGKAVKEATKAADEKAA